MITRNTMVNVNACTRCENAQITLAIVDKRVEIYPTENGQIARNEYKKNTSTVYRLRVNSSY